MSLSNSSTGDQESSATFFAPPRRSLPEQIAEAVQKISNSPVLDAALHGFGGWVCVLNDCRQILAVNNSLLEELGITDPAEVLGLRPGEVLKCVHAHDQPAGCGTSRFCGGCGAAVAMVAAQQDGQPHQLECLLTINKDGLYVDREFMVNCSPFHMRGESLLLIAMRDISEEKRRAAFEQAFLHDVSGVLSALAIASDRLNVPAFANNADVAIVREATSILLREVRLQRLLTHDNPRQYPIETSFTSAWSILQQTKDMTASHHAARGQRIALRLSPENSTIETDVSLLQRVLSNMVVNALEAGQPGDEVRISEHPTADTIEFSVWNRQAMPESAALRVFQRYFSTKPGGGRGLGTYIIKLLGEKLLGGKVSFTSTPTDGTTFRIQLPLAFQARASRQS